MENSLDKQKLNILKQSVRKLAGKYHLSLVLLFGSQAKGKSHALSDFDIAFYSKCHLRPIEVAKMQFELTMSAKIATLELTDLKEATPLLLKQIADHSLPLYEDGSLTFSSFKIYAYKRYMEAEPILKMRQKQFNNFIKSHVR